MVDINPTAPTALNVRDLNFPSLETETAILNQRNKTHLQVVWDKFTLNTKSKIS